MGTRFPIFELNAQLGIKGFLGGDYEYQRLSLRVSDRFPINPIGQSEVIIEAGKIWGTLPYPLLQMFPDAWQTQGQWWCVQVASPGAKVCGQNEGEGQVREAQDSLPVQRSPHENEIQHARTSWQKAQPSSVTALPPWNLTAVRS